MSEANATVNYGARPIQGDFTAGTVVVGAGVDANGSPVFVQATAANRATNGRADGIVITSTANGSPALMVTTGRVDATIANIANIASRPWVRVTATGTLECVAVPQTGDDVVGRAEANGDFHASFGFITPAMANVS